MKISMAFCLCLVLISPRVMADKYWVLGSFSEKKNAIAENIRLEKLLGDSISLRQFKIKDQQYYRLLISDAGFSPLIQKMLASANLTPWGIEIDKRLETEAVEQKTVSQRNFYWVAGSYSDVSEALEAENKLSKFFNQVSNQAALLKGKVYHRVLVGPIPDSLVSSTRLSLSDNGFLHPWLINARAENLIDKKQVVSAAKILDEGESPNEARQNRQKIETVLSVPATSYLPKQTLPHAAKKRGDGFNLARLPKKNLDFSMPSKRIAKGKWYFDAAIEHRQFTKGGLFQLEKAHSSLRFESEYTRSWNDENDLFTFIPFYRWDNEDEDRTHFDIRELSWIHVFNDWELRTGIRKVFWGVTEAQHLVDIINQTDNLENVNGEEKLGQGMINLSWISDWGIFDIYWLLGFREREYAGRNGRLRLPFVVDEDLATFESGAENSRSDFALRWTQTIGELELGLSHFSGTTREPRMAVAFKADATGVPIDALFIPHYEVIDQTGLDAQYFIGDWALKLELISRSGQGPRFNAFTLGFEKTIVGFFGSRADLGIVAEYLYDNRQQEAPVIGEDDLAIGFRLTLNNAADSTALLVFLIDRDSDEILTSLEASTRIGSNWRLILDATIFSGSTEIQQGFSGILSSLGNNNNEEFGLFQDEDFVRIELTRYF